MLRSLLVDRLPLNHSSCGNHYNLNPEINQQRALSVNRSEIVSFHWGVADLIRDTFTHGKYQDVILPLRVLRRLDCVLADTKERVLTRQAELKGKGLEDLDAQLRRYLDTP